MTTAPFDPFQSRRSPIKATEPLVALYAKWKRAEIESNAAADRQSDTAIQFFAARENGSPDTETLSIAYDETWDAWLAAGRRATEVAEEIIKAEAQGPLGTLIKLRVAATFASGDLEGVPSDDFGDRFIVALLADAERIAGGVS